MAVSAIRAFIFATWSGTTDEPPPPPPQFGVRVGNSTLIDTLDYSDSFTGTVDGGARTGPTSRNSRPRNVQGRERSRNLPSFFNPTSFSIAAESPAVLASSMVAQRIPQPVGAGSDTGFTQSGGSVDFAARYGLRDHYTVQADAIQVADRIDISSGSAPAIAAPNSLSVFFRGDGSGNASLYNGAVDTSIQSVIPALTRASRAKDNGITTRSDSIARANSLKSSWMSSPRVSSIWPRSPAARTRTFSNDFVGVGGGVGGETAFGPTISRSAAKGPIPQLARVPIPGIFNTGVDDNGVPLGDDVDDPHYNLLDIGSGSLPDSTVRNQFPISTLGSERQHFALDRSQ